MRKDRKEYVEMCNAIARKNEISTTRKMMEIESRERMGKCIMCEFIKKYGRRTQGNGKGKKRVMVASQQRGVHFCEYHENYRNCLMSYGYEFSKVSGKPTGKDVSVSFEFECKFDDDEKALQSLALMIYDLCFAPTSDCTVDCEFKSPIYISLQAFTKAMGKINDMINKGLCYIDDDCGTHIHASVYDYIDENGKPHHKHDYTALQEKEIYENLFFPTCRYIDTMSIREMVKYFGSGYREYAENPINYTRRWYDGHSQIFNVQHEYSVEFRLPRFDSAISYKDICLYMQEIVTNIDLYQSGLETAENVGKMNLKTTEKYFPKFD